MGEGGLVQEAGGALYVTLSGGRFISNTASSVAGIGCGGVCVGGNPDAANTLFAGNQASGGAALQLAGSQYTLRHVTIAYPVQGSGPAILLTSGTATITNTIIAGYPVGISQTAGTLYADYDLFFTTMSTQTSGGTMHWSPHNLNANPRFVNPAAGDYHLAAGSPAIDTGTNIGVTTDLDGVTRPQCKGYDIGAYEYRCKVYLPLVLRQQRTARPGGSRRPVRSDNLGTVFSYRGQLKSVGGSINDGCDPEFSKLPFVLGTMGILDEGR